MYQSRLHATNGIVSVALDVRSGEILEIVNERSGDNIVKSNCLPNQWMPFMMEIYKDGKTVKAHPARFDQIHENPALAAVIAIDQQEKSADIHVDYPCIVAEETVYPVHVHMDIRLPEGDCKTVWNLQAEMDGINEIGKVYFPYINGVWLGDTWEDDTLIFPNNAGMKLENPVHVLSAPAQIINWKWQEYRYGYNVNGCGAPKDERDCYYMENPYSGPASMLWMDLYDKNENTGVYLTCRDDDFRLLSVRADTFGETRPGMGLAIVHNAFRKEGSWESQNCILGLHEGDWHVAAQDYRAWRNSRRQNETARRHRPVWFEKSAGLVAHYDFKYQTHGIVHRFRDIPGLLEQAQAMGFDHLLLSGWNYDGFDHGFPQYWPDPDLGTEEELQAALKKVKEMGGHVAFYVNSRLCNTKYEDRKKTIDECAIMDHDGNLKIEQYGSKDLEFAALCNQAEPWQKEFVGVIDYLTHKIGADSMYLDQLAMGSGVLCFHPGHHHPGPDHWNDGYVKMLGNMRENYDEEGMALIFEGCSDIHGWGVSGQLISTMFRVNAFPEAYRYTFPDEVLVDMMNPKRNSGMRAEHVARQSTFLLYRAFVYGMYFWCYDLEYDNTFRRDPEQYVRLQKTVALRKAWLEKYGAGKYIDNDGLLCVPDGLIVKRYELEGKTLIACANEHLQKETGVDIAWDAPAAKAVLYGYQDAKKEITLPVSVRADQCGYIAHIDFPADEELAFVVLSKD